MKIEQVPVRTSVPLQIVEQDVVQLQEPIRIEITRTNLPQ